MIKLTVNSGKSTRTYTFQKFPVSIGTAGSSVDLEIEEKNFSGVLVRIVQEADQLLAINSANDPFITLNDMPFGKKSIKPNDQLQIGKIAIDIELSQILSQAEESANESDTLIELPKEFLDTKNQLIDVLDQALKSKKEPQQHSFEPEVPNGDEFDLDFPDHESDQWQDLDFEALVKEVESMADEELQSPPPSGNKVPLEREPLFVRKSIKDDSSSEAPVEHEQTKEFSTEKEIPQEPQDDRWSRNWRLIAAILLAFGLFTLLFIGTLYFSATGKRSGEVFRAAQGVSDISMALTFAQTYGIKPHKQNWSDPDFIRNNLNALLSPHFTPLANLDNHCHFKDTPYFLRVYNNSSLSQFLVIAQPVPSLLQWLIPKPSIVVDSRSMELRKLTDLRPLNRLLFASNILDEEQVKEISRLVKEGELIPLSALRSRYNRLGFTAPTELSLYRPEAENLIYNAPRYHLFGEGLLEHAKMLTQSAASSKDLETFRNEINFFSQFPHLILYSSRGLEAALDAHRTLMTLVPQETFLKASLDFHKQGTTSSHMLLVENSPKNSVAFKPPGQMVEKDVSENEATLFHVLPEPRGKDLLQGPLQEHPFTLQLTALLAARQQALMQITAKIQNLLQHNTHTLVPRLTELMGELIDEYERTDHETQQQLLANLQKLSHDYQSLPLTQILMYIKLSGAEPLIMSFLEQQQRDHPDLITSAEQIDSALSRIPLANSLEELASAALNSVAFVQLERITDVEELVARQNELQILVLRQLEHILLSSHGAHYQVTNLTHDQQLLKQILQLARIDDHDILEFYLSELTHRYMHQHEDTNQISSYDE